MSSSVQIRLDPSQDDVSRMMTCDARVVSVIVKDDCLPKCLPSMQTLLHGRH